MELSNSIQNLFYLRQRLIVGAQIMLVCDLTIRGMSQKLTDQFSGHSSLQPAGRAGAPEASKANTICAAIQVCIFAGSGEGSLNFTDSKDSRIVFFVAALVKPSQFSEQAITDYQCATSQCLSVQGRQGNAPFLHVNILPAKRKNLASPHSGIESTDDDCSEMLPLSGTRGQQSAFFIEGHDAGSPALIGFRNQGVTFAERTANDPAFTLCDVENPAGKGKFTVDTGDASYSDRLPILVVFSDSSGLQSLSFVGFQIRVSDPSYGNVPKVSEKRFGVCLDRATRAKAANFSIVSIGGSGNIAFEIPREQDGEFSLWVKLPANGQRLAFFESIAETVTSFCFGDTGAPDSFPFPIDVVRDAGIVKNPILLAGAFYLALYDLNFMRSGHDLPCRLHLQKILSLSRSVRDREVSPERLKKASKSPVKSTQDVLSNVGVLRDSRLRIKRSQVRALLGAPSFLSNSIKRKKQRGRRRADQYFRLYLENIATRAQWLSGRRLWPSADGNYVQIGTRKRRAKFRT